jgi:prophage antirepressor-like protein
MTDTTGEDIAEVAEAVAEEKTEPTEAIAQEMTPLVALFLEHNIRVLGTAEEPLFCVADVAAHIADTNPGRTLKNYAPDIYVRWELACDPRGAQQRTRFLTEAGAYKYLLQSRSPLAEPFQLFVYGLLKAERKRTVDSIQLSLKIAETKYAESQRAKAALRQGELGLMRLVNDERESVRKLQKAKATLQKENEALKRERNAAADPASTYRSGWPYAQ